MPNTHVAGVRGSVPHPAKQQIIDDAFKEIMEGKRLDQIAQKHGVSRPTIWLWLSATGDEYKAVRDAYIDLRLYQADEELDTADDQLSLMRAREKLRSAQWYAERRDRQRYGQVAQAGPTSDMQVTINIGSVGQPAQVVIEHEPDK